MFNQCSITVPGAVRGVSEESRLPALLAQAPDDGEHQGDGGQHKDGGGSVHYGSILLLLLLLMMMMMCGSNHFRWKAFACT
jgi:hypothetical protein